jgi:hypothetical protein
MLQFLVTSKVRRRLLVLLWSEKKSGSVAELAELAGVSFASTHAELKAMHRLQLVRSERVGGKEVFSADPNHPNAELLSRLAEADVPLRSVPSSEDEGLKQKLASLGAPLRGVKPVPVAPSDLMDTLVHGTELARRDAVVARSLPLCVWKNRDHLDGKALQKLTASAEQKHALAFFLELAGELGGDRRLAGLAEGLRDQRLTQARPFFNTMSAGSARDFPMAAKWGFLINAELDSFRALFDKFVTK